MISIEEKRTLWLKKIDASRDLFEKDFPENIEKYRKGDAALLQSLAESLGYEAVIVGPVCVDGEPVSSTRIRALLTEGKKGEAERLAGHALNTPQI